MASGERVALEPALVTMLAQHFHYAAVGRNVVVVALDVAHQASVLDFEHVAKPIGVGLVGAEQAEVLLFGIAREYIAQHLAEGARRFDLDAARLLERHRVFGERRDIERDGQESAVGVRIRAHPAVSLRRDRSDFRFQRAAFIEQFVGPVTAHPLFEQFQMLGIFLHVCRAAPDARGTSLRSARRRRPSARSILWACAARSQATSAASGAHSRAHRSGSRESSRSTGRASRRTRDASLADRRPRQSGPRSRGLRAAAQMLRRRRARTRWAPKFCSRSDGGSAAPRRRAPG